jgi:hypothetical protein
MHLLVPVELLQPIIRVLGAGTREVFRKQFARKILLCSLDDSFLCPISGEGDGCIDVGEASLVGGKN